jgi:hypothetical protein
MAVGSSNFLQFTITSPDQRRRVASVGHQTLSDSATNERKKGQSRSMLNERAGGSIDIPHRPSITQRYAT